MTVPAVYVVLAFIVGAALGVSAVVLSVASC